MPDDPANVRGAEENIVIPDVPEAGHVVVNADGVSAMNVDYALGLSGGAAGIEDIERIFRVHYFREALSFLCADKLMEINFALREFDGRFGAPQDHNFFHQI